MAKNKQKKQQQKMSTLYIKFLYVLILSIFAKVVIYFVIIYIYMYCSIVQYFCRLLCSCSMSLHVCKYTFPFLLIVVYAVSAGYSGHCVSVDSSYESVSSERKLEHGLTSYPGRSWRQRPRQGWKDTTYGTKSSGSWDMPLYMEKKTIFVLKLCSVC